MSYIISFLVLVNVAIANPQGESLSSPKISFIPPQTFPTVLPHICIPPATPDPSSLGRLVGVVSFYKDTKCKIYSGCEKIYEKISPRCRFLAGNSIKATYLEYKKDSEAPATGTVLLPWMDKFCEKYNGPAFGGSDTLIKLFNVGDCVDATNLPTYKIMYFPGEV